MGYMIVESCNLCLDEKGGVHILGEICPRSDPDIAHMGYYLDDPLTV